MVDIGDKLVGLPGESGKTIGSASIAPEIGDKVAILNTIAGKQICYPVTSPNVGDKVSVTSDLGGKRIVITMQPPVIIPCNFVDWTGWTYSKSGGYSLAVFDVLDGRPRFGHIVYSNVGSTSSNIYKTLSFPSATRLTFRIKIDPIWYITTYPSYETSVYARVVVRVGGTNYQWLEDFTTLENDGAYFTKTIDFPAATSAIVGMYMVVLASWVTQIGYIITVCDLSWSTP